MRNVLLTILALSTALTFGSKVLFADQITILPCPGCFPAGDIASVGIAATERASLVLAPTTYTEGNGSGGAPISGDHTLSAGGLPPTTRMKLISRPAFILRFRRKEPTGTRLLRA